MLLSAIIVNHNCSYLTRLCIEALRKSNLEGGMEIIVVDNASDEENLSYLKKLRDEKIITLIPMHENVGYGRGNNAGAAKASGEFLLIINPDVVVEPSTVRSLLHYMQDHPGTGIVAPQLYFYNDKIQDSCRRFMNPLDLIIKRTPLRHMGRFRERYIRYTMEDFDHSKVQQVDIVTGACFVMSRSLFHKLRGFDERFFLFMEDIDLCRRVWGAGHPVVYYPKERALHSHKRLSGGSFFGSLFRKIFWIHVSSAIKYFWKWRGIPYPERTTL